MTIKSITATYGRTQNTGNFSGLRVDVSYTADVAEGENYEAVRDELLQLAKADCIDAIWQSKESYAADWPAAPR